MKKIFFLCTAVLVLTNSFGTSNFLFPKKLNASELYLPIGKTGKKISLAELSTIRLGDLQTLTGKKMSFAEKITFKIAQKKLRRSIDFDGAVANKKLEKLFQKKEGDSGFHLGGFALGFLLGLIGVLIAYLINDDFKHNRVKWAWIGCGVLLVLNIIIFAALV